MYPAQRQVVKLHPESSSACVARRSSTRRSAVIFATGWLSLGLAAGCARSPHPGPWQAAMAAWYLNHGPSRHDPPPPALREPSDDLLLLKRLGFACLTARGAIRRVGLTYAHGQLQAAHLVFVADEVFFRSTKEWPDSRGEITLHVDVSAGQPAAWIESQLNATIDRHFVLLLRDKPHPSALHKPPRWVYSLWPPRPELPAEDRWSLYPEEPALVARLRMLYQLLARHH